MTASDELISILPTVIVASVASKLARDLDKNTPCVKSCKEHTRKLDIKPHSFKN